MYEGLFHKPADASLVAADRACDPDRLSGGSNRGFGSDSRGGTRSCANGAERDLISDLPARSACPQPCRFGVDSCIPVSNPLECEAERHPECPHKKHPQATIPRPKTQILRPPQTNFIPTNYGWKKPYAALSALCRRKKFRPERWWYATDGLLVADGTAISPPPTPRPTLKSLPCAKPVLGWVTAVWKTANCLLQLSRARC